MSLKFCANLSFMFQEEASLLKRYTLAGGCGFKAVECAFPYDFSIDDVVTAKKNANVKQILINTPIHTDNIGNFGLASIPGKEEHFLEDIQLAAKYAVALDCKLVHIMSGIVEKPTEQHFNTYRSNLKVATSLFKKDGITALIEPINRYSVPGYYMNNYENALKIIADVGDNLKLMLDIFHLQQICGNLTRNVKELLNVVGHIQIAQVPLRNEPNTYGEIDYKYLLQHLENEKYTDWIGLEYKPLNGTKEGLSWISGFGYCL